MKNTHDDHSRVVYDPVVLAELEKRFNYIVMTGYNGCPGTASLCVSTSTVSSQSSHSPQASPLTHALEELTQRALPRLFYNFHGEPEEYASGGGNKVADIDMAIDPMENADLADTVGFGLEHHQPDTTTLIEGKKEGANISEWEEKISPNSVTAVFTGAGLFLDLEAPGASALAGSKTTYREFYGERSNTERAASLQPTSHSDSPRDHRERTSSIHGKNSSVDTIEDTADVDVVGIAFHSPKLRKLIHSPLLPRSNSSGRIGSPQLQAQLQTQAQAQAQPYIGATLSASLPHLDPLSLTLYNPLPLRPTGHSHGSIPATNADHAPSPVFTRDPTAVLNRTCSLSPMSCPSRIHTPTGPSRPRFRKKFDTSAILPTRLCFEDEDDCGIGHSDAVNSDASNDDDNDIDYMNGSELRLTTEAEAEMEADATRSYDPRLSELTSSGVGFHQFTNGCGFCGLHQGQSSCLDDDDADIAMWHDVLSSLSPRTTQQQQAHSSRWSQHSDQTQCLSSQPQTQLSPAGQVLSPTGQYQQDLQEEELPQGFGDNRGRFFRPIHFR